MVMLWDVWPNIPCLLQSGCYIQVSVEHPFFCLTEVDFRIADNHKEAFLGCWINWNTGVRRTGSSWQMDFNIGRKREAGSGWFAAAFGWAWRPCQFRKRPYAERLHCVSFPEQCLGGDCIFGTSRWQNGPCRDRVSIPRNLPHWSVPALGNRALTENYRTDRRYGRRDDLTA